MWYVFGGMIGYLLLVFYLSIKKKVGKQKQLNTNNSVKIWLIFSLFSVFCVCFGDFWGYGDLVTKAYETYESNSNDNEWYKYLHMEPLYNYLSVLCQGNYIVWRFILFGGQFVFLVYVLTKIGKCSYELFYIFSLMALQSICGGRVSWGICVYWFSLYAYINTKQKKYIFFLICSFIAHNSMLLLIPLSFFYFLKISKFFAVAALISVPVLAQALSSSLNSFLDKLELIESTQVEMLSYKLTEYYVNADSFIFWGHSIGETIQYSLYRLPMYYLIGLILIHYFQGKLNNSNAVEKLFNITFVLFLFTIVTIVAKFGSGSFYERYFVMLYIPVFILTYVENRDFYIKRKDFRVCVSCLGISFVAVFLKAFYYYSISGI